MWRSSACRSGKNKLEKIEKLKNVEKYCRLAFSSFHERWCGDLGPPAVMSRTNGTFEKYVFFIEQIERMQKLDKLGTTSKQ